MTLAEPDWPTFGRRPPKALVRVGQSAGVVLLPFILLLSGCVDTPADEDPGASPLPRLADFVKCDFSYPNGEKVPCENQAGVASVTGSPPGAPWVCEGSIRLPNRDVYDMYWNPLTNQRGVDYSLPRFSTATGGVLLKRMSNESSSVYAWLRPEPTGFLEFPSDAPQGTDVSFFLYKALFSTMTPALQNSTLNILWSTFEGEYWVLFELVQDDRSYYFQTMEPFWVFHEKTFYAVGDLYLQGADFDLRITYEHTGGSGFQVGDGNPPC